ncbi:hypothetical protein [Streptomyces sp. SAJ15]|uniref:hypothetical protein n=1 Tax=Streptomyces sp. SAJ15 TaxID=2011095 RepID=UPI0021B25E2A|nr:hypothetical protein [Streptomyces sp. SAJ15]
MAERHRAEHEVHHVATDLAAWSREHVQRVSEAAPDYGLNVEETIEADSVFPPSEPGQSRSGAKDQGTGTGLTLLRDLRDLHLAATENSLYGDMLAQAAQATRDDTLLDLASACQPRTLRPTRWIHTMVENLSPQLLTSV